MQSEPAQSKKNVKKRGGWCEIMRMLLRRGDDRRGRRRRGGGRHWDAYVIAMLSRAKVLYSGVYIYIYISFSRPGPSIFYAAIGVATWMVSPLAYLFERPGPNLSCAVERRGDVMWLFVLERCERCPSDYLRCCCCLFLSSAAETDARKHRGRRKLQPCLWRRYALVE